MSDELKAALIEKMGRDIDAALLAQKDAPTMEQRSLRTKASIVEGKTVAVATTDAVDRDGEIVEPNGIDFGPFDLNPIVLFGHDYRRPAVGKVTNRKVFDDRVEMEIEWADTTLGRELKYLYENAFMNAFSIGFMPRKYKIIGDQFVWIETELVELSAVPIPSNRLALAVRSAAESGLNLKAVQDFCNREASAESLEDTERNAAKSRYSGLADMHVARSKRFQGSTP